MKKTDLKFFGSIAVLILLILCLVGLPVFAWLYVRKDLAFYAPVSSPEALYIGAGHVEDERFEDIRYLYFDGIDASNEDHWDRVFCVYGKSVSGYRLQLAYTTNNQFSYEIYHATESSVSSDGAIAYTTHTDTPATYYYSIDGDAIAGTYLNKTEIGGEVLASDAKHADTYGAYDDVHKHAEPIYWQTRDVETGSARSSFVNYYIMRVHTGGKTENDRETDVICIAAKSFSV